MFYGRLNSKENSFDFTLETVHYRAYSTGN